MSGWFLSGLGPWTLRIHALSEFQDAWLHILLQFSWSHLIFESESLLLVRRKKKRDFHQAPHMTADVQLGFQWGVGGGQVWSQMSLSFSDVLMFGTIMSMHCMQVFPNFQKVFLLPRNVCNLILVHAIYKLPNFTVNIIWDSLSNEVERLDATSVYFWSAVSFFCESLNLDMCLNKDFLLSKAAHLCNRCTLLSLVSSVVYLSCCHPSEHHYCEHGLLCSHEG